VAPTSPAISSATSIVIFMKKAQGSDPGHYQISPDSDSEAAGDDDKEYLE
jgi:hypothetical protein